MAQLDLEFSDELGKARHIRINNAMPALTKEVVKTAMDKICELKLFEIDMANAYVKPIRARYIDRQVTLIYQA